MTQVLDGRYELGDRIGRGGAGRVHRAVDRRLQREVAVKMLDDQAAAQADPAGRDRFLVEARTAAQLRHPHVVTVFDAGESDGELFIVMELVDGVTLGELIATRGPLPPADAARIAMQILGALQEAHDRNIVHRDVKPANVIIDAGGDAHLTDFGIARRLDDIEDRLTTVGHVVGTPTYMAPEQVVGGSLGAATDVYLVGLVLDEMLTARRTRTDARSDVAAVGVGAAVDPRDVAAGTHDALADVVVRATDPDPDRRFASAAEMSRAIAAAHGVEPVTSAASATGLADATIRFHADTGREPASPTATLVMPAPDQPRPGTDRTPRRRAAVVAIVALAAVGLAAAASGGPTLPAPPAATSPPATVPATVAAVPTTPATTAEPVAAVGGSGGGDPGGNGKGKGHGRGKD